MRRTQPISKGLNFDCQSGRYLRGLVNSLVGEGSRPAHHSDASLKEIAWWYFCGGINVKKTLIVYPTWDILWQPDNNETQRIVNLICRLMNYSSGIFIFDWQYIINGLTIPLLYLTENQCPYIWDPISPNSRFEIFCPSIIESLNVHHH